MAGSRRNFLARSGWLSAAVFGLPRLTWAAEPRRFRPGQKPRHIIHLVSDGTSSGTLSSADQFSHLVRGHGLAWLRLYQQPSAFSALVDMRSLNSLVTDSAAASSSWGCGSRVVNGALNVLPDGRDLYTLYQLTAEQGWKRGLVTTTEITHATPAGFAINSETRDAAQGIAAQYLDRKIEVLLGGGSQFFKHSFRRDGRDLLAEARLENYAVLQTRAELLAASVHQRWLGVFAGSHLPFTLDQLHDPASLAQVPTLALMTRRALDHLRHSNHFVLQVEGGRVDHAGHNCDIAAAVREAIAFDEALAVCLDFQRQEPDTLLVVTVDHGTGNPGLNGLGKGYGETAPRFARLVDVQQSFPVILKELNKQTASIRMNQVIQQSTGYAVPDKKAELLARFLDKKTEALNDSLASQAEQLGQLLANYVGVGWASSSHTADYVPLVAQGPGAELFRGFIRNTDVCKNYLKLTGIRFANPEVPLWGESPPHADTAEKTEAYLD